MKEFFSKLLDTGDFPARWNCGEWDRFHGWLHIGSDVAIWAAYGAIPLALIYYCGRKKKEILFARVVILFAIFIVACGTTHLIEAIIFYHPIYRLSGLMKFATAVVSWITVFVVWRNLPQALKLPGLAKTNGQLQEELERRRTAEQEAALAHEELKSLTQMLTHDLRNPLSSAMMMAEVAAGEAEKSGAKSISRQMEAVLMSLTTMKRTVQKLDVETNGSGTPHAEESVDLNGLIGEVEVFLGSTIHASDAELRVGELPSLVGDRTKFFHLFTNLVENSIKYRSEAPPVVSIDSVTNGEYHRICVRDNGVGIREHELEKVFSSSFRGENGSKVSGTGMGLSHCRKIVAGFGGQIHAFREDSGGTRIEVEIPVSDSPHGEEAYSAGLNGAC